MQAAGPGEESGGESDAERGELELRGMDAASGRLRLVHRLAKRDQGSCRPAVQVLRRRYTVTVKSL